MKYLLLSALAAGALAVAPASATVLFGTYAPSDTAVHIQEAPQNFLPLRYRMPDQSFDGAAGVSGWCANAYCNPWIGQAVTTEFVATSSFLASKLIVAAALSSPYGNRRVGFNVSRWDDDTSTWQGLSYAQIESGLVPQGTIVEIEVPFGEAGGGFDHFNYQPIQFNEGDRYRIEASPWAGGLGSFVWYNSAEAAAPGQSIQYEGAYSSFGGTPSDLAWQPAFAFTDGGDLQLAAVPEAASWALMVLGFGATGAAMRKRKPGLRFG